MAIRVVFAGSRPLGHFALTQLMSIPDVEIVGCLAKKPSEGSWWDEDPWFIANDRFPLLEDLNDVEFDFGLSVNYWRIIEKNTLERPPFGFANVHHSYFLNLRGRDMFSHAITNARAKRVWFHGTTLHYMGEELDSGPIISSSACAITENDTARSLFERTEELSKIMLSEWLPRIVTQKLTDLPLPAPFAPLNMRKEINNEIDFANAQISIYDHTRALEFDDCFEPPFFLNQGKKIYLTTQKRLATKELFSLDENRGVYERQWSNKM